MAWLVPNTVAFGSTRDIRRPGSILFVNCPFPTLGEDALPPGPITIGEGCVYPYTTDSLFNISGMSYGALSKPAVLALFMGAKRAGCWVNTGEGGVSPYHIEGGADIVFQIGAAKNGVPIWLVISVMINCAKWQMGSSHPVNYDGVMRGS
jgi:hypothetical protein